MQQSVSYSSQGWIYTYLLLCSDAPIFKISPLPQPNILSFIVVPAVLTLRDVPGFYKAMYP